MSMAKYDRKRLEQGGKNIFQEINNLARETHHVHNEFPEVTPGKTLTIALDRKYPEVERNIARCPYKV